MTRRSCSGQPGGAGARRAARPRALVLASLGALVLGMPAAARSPAGEAKTLTRFHDPVVVRTGLLAALPDHRTARYRVYAARGGVLEAIPFQFDARDAGGELVLSGEGAEGDFTFDDDDELVFMAKDAGDRIGADRLPDASDAVFEIEDGARGGRGWVYVAHFPGEPPPRSPVRYAVFDTARGEARALYYEVRYSRDRSNFLAGVRVSPAAGGSGEELVRRMLMRINPTFSLLITTWAPTFTEESFSVTTEGVKNGPVRAVRRVRQALDLGPLFPEIPNGTVSTYYYFSSFVTPSTFSIPALALRSLRAFRFETLDDFGAAAADMRYWDAANPDGVPLGARDGPAGAERDHEWWVVSGPAGTVLQTLRIPEAWRTWGITRGTVFADAAAANDAPDRGAGYRLLRMTNLQPGAYRIDASLVVLPSPYRPGDEAQALAMLQEPLAVRVRPVEIAAAAR